MLNDSKIGQFNSERPLHQTAVNSLCLITNTTSSKQPLIAHQCPPQKLASLNMHRVRYIFVNMRSCVTKSANIQKNIAKCFQQCKTCVSSFYEIMQDAKWLQCARCGKDAKCKISTSACKANLDRAVRPPKLRISPETVRLCKMQNAKSGPAKMRFGVHTVWAHCVIQNPNKRRYVEDKVGPPLKLRSLSSTSLEHPSPIVPL